MLWNIKPRYIIREDKPGKRKGDRTEDKRRQDRRQMNTGQKTIHKTGL